MPSVYLETTIVSYLTARPSRDVVVAGHQQTTRDWWEHARIRYELVISEVVRRELEAGDADAAARRLAAIEDVPRLAFNDDVTWLAGVYQTELKLPAKAGNDVLHLAFAVAYAVDYLLTWNCTHIANGHTIKRLASINHRLDRQTPVIVTPEELLEG